MIGHGHTKIRRRRNDDEPEPGAARRQPRRTGGGSSIARGAGMMADDARMDGGAEALQPSLSPAAVLQGSCAPSGMHPCVGVDRRQPASSAHVAGRPALLLVLPACAAAWCAVQKLLPEWELAVPGRNPRGSVMCVDNFSLATTCSLYCFNPFPRARETDHTVHSIAPLRTRNG
jgi:hypothetical protein